MGNIEAQAVAAEATVADTAADNAAEEKVSAPIFSVPSPSKAPSDSPAKMRSRTASGVSASNMSDDEELKEAYINCVAASDLPDVKGFRGSINPYLVIKWNGQEIKKVPRSVKSSKSSLQPTFS